MWLFNNASTRYQFPWYCLYCRCVTIRRTLIILSAVSDSAKRLAMKPANIKDENWKLRHLPDHAQSNKLNWVLRLDEENFIPFLKQFTSTPRFLIWHFLLVTNAYFFTYSPSYTESVTETRIFPRNVTWYNNTFNQFSALFTTDSLNIFPPF